MTCLQSGTPAGRDATSSDRAHMPVVVQRFLAAERSGVMFTRFPGPNGQPRILVEHVEGGCEKLVKGEVTPERVWLVCSDTPPELLDGSLAPACTARRARHPR